MNNLVKIHSTLDGKRKFLRFAPTVKTAVQSAEIKINWGQNATIYVNKPAITNTADFSAYWIAENAPSHDPQYLTAITGSELNRLAGSYPYINFPSGNNSDNILIQCKNIPSAFEVKVKPTTSTVPQVYLDYKLYTGNDEEVYHGKVDYKNSHSNWPNFISDTAAFNPQWPRIDTLYGLLNYNINPDPIPASIRYMYSRGGTVTGQDVANSGTTVNLSASANYGFAFNNFTVNDSALVGSSFTMPDNSVNVSGNFNLTATGYVMYFSISGEVAPSVTSYWGIDNFVNVDNPYILSSMTRSSQSGPAGYKYSTAGTATNITGSGTTNIYICLNKSTTDNIQFDFHSTAHHNNVYHYMSAWRKIDNVVASAISSHPEALIYTGALEERNGSINKTVTIQV